MTSAPISKDGRRWRLTYGSPLIGPIDMGQHARDLPFRLSISRAGLDRRYASTD
jgi:hypothetical protein